MSGPSESCPLPTVTDDVETLEPDDSLNSSLSSSQPNASLDFV